MAAQLHAETEEADGVVGEAQRGVPTVCQPTGKAGDRADQPDSSGLGQLLCGRPLEQVLFVYQILGRKEDLAAFDASPETKGLRLEEVE